jgi:hypothetical protein
MKRILIAGLLGAVACFIWGFISWAVLPWHNATMPNLPNEDAVIEVMRSNVTATGVYQFPGHPATEAEGQAWMDKYKRGPFGMLIYHANGTNPMSAQPFIGGFVLNFVIATLAAYLLSLAVAKMTAYSQRVIFVTLLGVFAALASHIMAWNWMYIPTAYSLVMSADAVINSLVAGLVIAWQIKPATA